jgi:hypothetical protein
VTGAGPGIVVACPCGEVYELKPEYAGRLLECPACRRRLRAGQPRRAEAALADGPFDRDVFLLRERVLTVAAKYEVWSEAGRPVLYVERPTYPVRTALAYVGGALAAWIVFALGSLPAGGPAEPLLAVLTWGLAVGAFALVSMSLRPRRHVMVYRDDSRREPLLRVVQDQRVAGLVRTYTVKTPAGEVLARLRKHHLHNLVRKRWDVTTPGGLPLAAALEDSIVLSLLRRVLGSFFGLLRTNFLLLDAAGEVLGEFNRKLTLLDRYVLDLSADADRRLDRRVALALGVMLDTGERR